MHYFQRLTSNLFYTKAAQNNEGNLIEFKRIHLTSSAENNALWDLLKGVLKGPIMIRGRMTVKITALTNSKIHLHYGAGTIAQFTR
jgi:hypothetical protein